ncbi:MAG: DNA-processing protein DprA [Armatimonadota bacterium]|nr:MAG: DNA-processing protein DprA [Armatimonadota bacterium]
MALEAWLALSRAELRPAQALALLERFPSPDDLLAASAGEWRAVCPLSPSEERRLRDAAQAPADDDLRKLEELGGHIVTIRDLHYPPLLRQIHGSPPILYVRGEIQDCDQRAIAIVGTRRASPYGRLVAETLGRELARAGLTVISGLALGIDSAAHEGALQAGRTVGVCACGLDVTYPPSNHALIGRVVEHGAVIPEFPLGARPERWRFPARNRIISGLALATVVVEAPEKSGALITADHALDQGRDVFAVPGAVNTVQSRGTHLLIKQGAKLVETVDDILDELDLPAAPKRPEPPVEDLSQEESDILARLSLQQTDVDSLIVETQLPSSQVNAILTILELRGLVRRMPGNNFVRVH